MSGVHYLNRPLKSLKQYIKFVKHDENSGKKAELHGFVEFWSSDKYNVLYLRGFSLNEQEICYPYFLDKLRCDLPEKIILKLVKNEANNYTIKHTSFF